MTVVIAWSPFRSIHVTFRLWLIYLDVLYFHGRKTRSNKYLFVIGFGDDYTLQEKAVFWDGC